MHSKKNNLLLFCAFFLCSASLAGAIDSDGANPFQLTISEVMFDPQGSDDLEWIEVANISEGRLSIGSVKVYKGQHVLDFKTCDKINQENDFCSESHPVYYDKDPLELEKGELFIIANDREKFIEQYSSFQGKILESNFGLTNKQDENFIGLLQTLDSQAAWIDKLFYFGSWGLSGKSLEKKDLDKINNELNWTKSYVNGGTPGSYYEEKELEFSDKIRINEMFPDPLGDDQEGEFIELANLDQEAEIELEDWSLKDASGKQYFFEKQKIAPNSYLAVTYKQSKIILNNDQDKIWLIDPVGREVDKCQYNKSSSGLSWAKNDKGEYAWTVNPTPGQKNNFPSPKQFPKGIIFSEILPNPQGVDKNAEWVEIKNLNDCEVDLSDWYIKNKAEKKFKLSKIKIEAKGILAIKISAGGFSITNSDEKLRLFNPNGELEDEVSLTGTAKSGTSFNLTNDGDWRWSRFITPGKKNKLNSAANIKLKYPSKIYKLVKADFDAADTDDKDGDQLKFKWDFDDGHRSYLATTSHIFTKKGKYLVTLEVNDGSEVVKKQFKIEVKDFPKKNLKIVAILPNPQGVDSGKETVAIQNNTFSRVNLKGYKLATGSNKNKLINHPIYDDFYISPGKTEEISNLEISKFSLLNQKGYLALKYPNNQIADILKYERDKILEDEQYVLEDGQWNWIGAATKETVPVEANFSGQEQETEPEVLGSQTEAISFWPIVTANETTGQCEGYAKILVENWKSKNSRWLSWFGILSLF